MSHLTILLSSLILSFLSTCGDNEAFTLTQSPLSITVKEGEAVHMQCCWEGILNMQQVVVKCVSTNDTGVFICKMDIDIPVYQHRQGPGTQLKVERTNNSSTAESSKPIPLTTLLIPLTVAMGALSLCAFMCYWRKKKLMPYPGQATGRVGMVIHEVPHGEGEEVMEEEGEVALAENEGSTRSSAGSTQWCAVQVYESFDYFAVQSSEDG
ncbi:hypothetical protein SKAU_G00029490 [Synaphobranchus kaupii]|uniref:Uncharacterized protein n=1 Tax=Synaphobranchus kaupii TaxID=118154 RepID=A0A9Q1GDB9_SYNKA|nr:hypothetical protein SKAU_G00029490 [Synaphobranchus kaupii]